MTTTWSMSSKKTTAPHREYVLETHVSKSLEAARKMSRASADNQKERKSYSATLVRESKDLGNYIIEKRTSNARKNA